MLLTKHEKEIIAEENYALIFFAANLYSSTGIHQDELISIALVGYAKALNAYDTDKAAKFSTFAMNCIRNEILFFLRKEKKHMKNNISMNTILATDSIGNSICLEDIVHNSKGNGNLEDSVVLSESVEILGEILKDLEKNERYVIINRFGLYDTKIKTQKEIADTIGMSQANVSKIEKGVLMKLRKILTEKHNILKAPTIE